MNFELPKIPIRLQIVEFYITFFITLIPYCLFAQDASYLSLSSIDGLPSNDVFQVIQDDQHLTYIATSSGLCAYNGYRIYNINTVGFGSNEFTNLKKDSHGNIWGLSLLGEIGIIRDKSIVKIYPDKDIKIFDFSFTKDHIYLLSDTVSAFHYEASKDSLYLKYNTSWNFSNHRNVLTGIDDKVVLITRRKTYVLDEPTDEVTSISSNYNCNYEHIPIHNQSFYLPDGHGITQYNLELDSLSRFKIENHQQVTPLSNGLMMTSLLSKGIKFSPYTDWHPLEYFDELIINYVFEDELGTIWLATKYNGVLMIKDLYFNSLFDREEKPFVNCFSNVHRDSIVYIGTKSGKLGKLSLNNNSIKWLHQFSEPIDEIIAVDDLIVCASPQRLCFINKNFDPIGLNINPKSIAFNNEYGLAAGRTEIHYFKRQHKRKTFDPDNDLKSINQINGQRLYELQPRDGQTFLYTSNTGLYELNLSTGEQNRIIKNKDNMLKFPLPLDTSSIMYITNDSTLFILKENTDAVEYIKTNFQETVQRILPVANHIWILRNSKAEVFHKEEKNLWTFVLYAHGRTQQINDVFSMGNEYYFATNEGVFSQKSPSLRFDQRSKRNWIENIFINNKRSNINENLRIKYGDNIKIEFYAVNYHDNADENFFYLLSSEKSDSKPIKTSSYLLSFENLRPGNYEFFLSHDPNAFDPNQVDTFSFTVRPPFYQTWYFFIGSLLCVGAISYFIMRHRFERKRKRIEELFELKNELNLEKIRGIQAQLNPHFIQNLLNNVNHRLLVDEPKKGSKLITKFSRFLRDFFDYNDHSEISLQDELIFLQSYIQLEQEKLDENIEFNIKISEELNLRTSEIIIPTMIFQPLIENSIKYRNKTKDLSIELSLSLDNHRLHAVLQDNGGPEITIKPIKNNPSGIGLVQKRLLLINGHDKSLNIEINEIGAQMSLYINVG